ncbi:MAG: SHOCT domain-containing protein [Thermoplasmata archaeon]|nr:SHOCT domain-containing protein [Thermoplasmata archaeon]
MATVAPLPSAPASAWDPTMRGFRRHPSVWVLGPLVVCLALVGLAVLGALFVRAGTAPAHGFPFFFFPGFVFGLLFLFWIAWSIVRWTVRPYWGWRAGGWPYQPWGGDPALAIARQRYARGEISREEFGSLLKDLTPPGGQR